MNDVIEARAPGRVNLIGDHTDYTGGLVLPMAIDRWTVIRGRRGGATVRLRSSAEAEPAIVACDEADPPSVSPPWARYVAGVVAELRPSTGFDGTVTTDIPIGAGLSSSAALEVAVALALGFDGTPRTLAELCRRAEHRASGVPCGIMDQLCCAAGVEGAMTLIDCQTSTVTAVPLPLEADVVVVFGHHRQLAGSPYAERVAQCSAAERVIGPLRLATVADTSRLVDEVVRARARHVVTENQRVRGFVAAVGAGDLAAAGGLMVDSHRSLRDDYATSTPQMDALVERIAATPGVYGARMTGGGFGGCAVALSRPGALTEGWVVRPVGGAAVRYTGML